MLKSFRRLGSLIFLSGISTLSASAQATDWAATPCSPSLFSNGNCWIGGIAPGTTGVANFDTGGATTIAVGWTGSVTNASARILNDDVAWNLGGFTYTLTTSPTADLPSLTLARLAGNTARLGVTNGTLNNTFTGIGIFAGSDGALDLGPGATLNSNQSITVGTAGNGELDIHGGASITTQHVWVAKDAGSSGAWTVTGPGSQALTFDFIVGLSGTGSMRIDDGALVYASQVNLAGAIGSAGSLIVDGAGSRLANVSSISIGSRGSGELVVRAGGVVDGTTQVASLAGSAGATGTATIEGVGSRWNGGQNLYVGRTGQGTLNVLDGGFVEGSPLMGWDSGSTGTMIVDGLGSGVRGNTVAIGYAGSASVLISNGGSIQTTYGGLAQQARSSGSVTVTGTGSKWTMSDIFNVGGVGNAAVSVRDGGAISSKDGSIGAQGIGVVSVDGAGSTWDVEDELHVGGFYNRGNGTLDVSGGGTVTTGTVYMGRRTGSVGQATVYGSGSTWEVADSIYVAGDASASGGTGTLTVADYATVAAGNTIKVWRAGAMHLDRGQIGAPLVDVAGGRLDGNGSVIGNVANAGTVAPGLLTGRLDVSGDYTQAAAATLAMEIAGIAPVSGFDVLEAGGTAYLDGLLRVELLGGFSPMEGDFFDILHAPVINGSFASTFLPTLQAGLGWNVDYLVLDSGSVVRLQVAAVPLPGALLFLVSGLGILTWGRWSRSG